MEAFGAYGSDSDDEQQEAPKPMALLVHRMFHVQYSSPRLHKCIHAARSA